MSTLETLANMHAQIVLDAATLRDALYEERLQAHFDGMRMAKEINGRAWLLDREKPYTKKEAAQALGFSEGTIDNMRKRGDLVSYEYGGQVRIEAAEIERFKLAHKALYSEISQNKAELSKKDAKKLARSK